MTYTRECPKCKKGRVPMDTLEGSRLCQECKDRARLKREKQTEARTAASGVKAERLAFMNASRAKSGLPPLAADYTTQYGELEKLNKAKAQGQEHPDT
jgi:hypothetical protein